MEMSSNEFLKRLSDGRARRERLARTLEDATHRAREATYGVQSINGTLRLAMDGRFRIKGIAIAPEAYDDIDPDKLADTIVHTYNMARQTVHSKQIACMLDPLATQHESSSR